jgi:Ca-activated chloride channel family protein
MLATFRIWGVFVAIAGATIGVQFNGNAVAAQETPGASSTSQPPATFRSEIEVVALTVTVQQSDGSYVNELQRDNFAVFEEGVPQHVEFFGAQEVPIELVLMVDTSASMAARLPVIQKAAAGFVRALGARDAAAVMSFGPRAELRLPFTGNRTRIEDAIGSLRAGGTTGLYNALYVALHEFGAGMHTSDVRRRAIVLLSDGDDTSSLVTFDAVIERARRAGVALYVISLSRDPKLDRDGSVLLDRYEMQAMARETGAKAFFPMAVEELPLIYESIARELSHQYAIGYVPAARAADREFRRVAVVVNHPAAASVRTRTGYIAGS